MTPQILYFDVDSEDYEASPGKGSIGVEMAFVGLAPSPNRPDDRYNEPFGARSYKLIKAITDNYEVYVTNLIKTPQPPGKKPSVKLVEKWAPLLLPELRLFLKPGGRVLALGNESAKVLCPGFSSLRDDHGTMFYNAEIDAHVMPTYHFSVIGRDPTKFPIIKHDLDRFFENKFEEQQEFTFELPETLEDEEVFLDIETTGLDYEKDEITMVGFAGSNTPVYIIQKPTSEDYDRLFDLLRGKTLIGHNFQFDLMFLQNATPEIDWSKFRMKDTMLYAYVLGEEVLSLKHLTTKYTQRKGSRASGGFEDPEYLAEDVSSTRALYEVQSKRAEKQWITQLLCSLIPHFVRMRKIGVNINWRYFEDLVPELEYTLKGLFDELNEYGEINWNSPKQVAQALLDAGVPLYEKTPSGGISVSEPTITRFRAEHAVVEKLLKFREFGKNLAFVSSYKELAFDGYLHPKLSLTGTTTGRLACQDPNLQQVPREGPVKLLFTSRFPNGSIGLIDLSQAELRVAALLSGDDVLAEALETADVHKSIASSVYQIPLEEVSAFQRKKSKGVTFGLLYGGSPKGLAERIGVDESEVEKIVRIFYGKFPKLAEYLDNERKQVLVVSQSVTPLGRIRDFTSLRILEGDKSMERKAINTPIQATASDIMLIILDHVFRKKEELGFQSAPIFGVHDSSIHDIHPDEIMIIAEVVQQGFESLNDTPLAKLKLWRTLPIRGELILGPTWAHTESTNENYGPTQKYPCTNVS